ncbi:MAG: DNA cytosine methyltransferase [Verrucomicrobia bacterium]|nr:DNA cytosine methyltransferase [Verrucomicrobiota bacterium]
MRRSALKSKNRKQGSALVAPPAPQREVAANAVSYPIPAELHCRLKEEAPGRDATLQRYKVVSLFSGAMGLDIGLEKTGRFEVIACVEKEKSFADTIEANKTAGRILGQPVVFHRDIAQLEPAELMAAVGLKPGELDLLVGGPPCQSFSTAGKRGTVQDHRGTLLWQFLRFVEALKPKCFLMENVRGLLSAALRHRPIAERPEKGGPPLEPDEEPGSVVRSFAEDLQRIEGGKYHMDCFEVNAVNYGAPQLRERALFIGNRFNGVVEFATPTHAAANGVTAIDTLPLFDDSGTDALPWRTLGESLEGLVDPNPVILDFSPRKKRYLALVPPGSNWRSLPVEIQKESMGKAWFAKGGRSGWWRRLTFDLPCPTLVTMPNHAGTSLCHPTETRALTLREYARIQEFPDDWEICGTPAEQYAQIGNAVPVRLGEIAGKVVAPELDALAKRGFEPYSATPSAYRIVYVQSHVRTRQWFKDGKTCVWQDGAGEDNDKPSYGAPKTKRRSKVLIGA